MVDAQSWIAFFFGGWGSVTTVYLLLQFAALVKVRGKALYVVLAPLLLFLGSVYLTARAYRDESNLWPVPMLTMSAMGILYLGIAAALKYLGGRRTESRQ